jgi:CubicO group peptidase (beta-lactamase class C family)
MVARVACSRKVARRMLPRMRRVGAILPLAILLAVASPAAAQGPLSTERADAVRAFVRDALDQLDVPGAAVVIVGAEGIEFAEGFGSARDDGTLATPQTPFHVASLSKQLTSIAVMQLIESGDLELDATVRSYVDWFGAEGSETARITIRDLLAHTSGWSAAQGLTNRVDERNDDDAIERNVRRVASEPLAHPIGEFEYSNANYDALGYLVAVVSGQTYEQYMTDHVLAPLQMTHTHLSDDAARADGLAQGHYPFFGVTMAYDIPFARSSLPSSFIAASAEDLGHVLVAHLNSGEYAGQRILPADAMAALRQPLAYDQPAFGYGWGWWRWPMWGAGRLEGTGGELHYDVPVVVEHGGGHPTYASGMLLVPNAGFGVVVLMNLNDDVASSRFYQLHTGIAQILLDRGTPSISSYDPIERQYGRQIAYGLVVGLAALVFWAVRRQRRWSGESRQIPRGVLGIAFRVLPPLLICLGVVLGTWYLLLNRGDANSIFDIWRMVRLGPDLGIIMLALTVIGLGWAVIGTVWSWRLLRHREF